MGRLRTQGQGVEGWAVVVCIEEGWGGNGLDATIASGYHCGGPSLIHIPLMPVGNLWDRHALPKHTETHSPPPRRSGGRSRFLERGHNGVERFG